MTHSEVVGTMIWFFAFGYPYWLRRRHHRVSRNRRDNHG